MKHRLLTLIFFLALPAVAAAPRTYITTCDVQMQIRSGRDIEGLDIPGQRAEFILPCITKMELAKIIEDFAKGNVVGKDQALDALRRAKQIKLVLTPDFVMQEKD